MNLVNCQRLFLQVVLVLAIVDCIQLADTVSCTSVIDGDTIRLDTGETVRLIGIDAPELSQPGGEMSRQYLAHLILGKRITLDKGYEDKDKYNRLLRFVYIGYTCVNEEMIRQGYAEARYLSPDVLPSCKVAHYFFPKGYNTYMQGLIRIHTKYGRLVSPPSPRKH